MTYTVLARRWRPRRFADLVGQEHVVQALVNGLEQDRLHHAFLFTGTRGVGKTTIARILAKSLNCETGVSAEPCGECGTCQDIDQGRFVDLLEIDAASRTKVDDTREILDNVQYAPSRGRYKVYLIDEVHMLSLSSFNALLKTLEEPPPHVKFVLATTDPHKIPVTILSRCLRFNLRRLRPQEIGEYLQHMLDSEQIGWDEGGLALIARAADGSMRDGLSLLDQALAYGGGSLKEADTQRMLGTVEQRHLLNILQALQAQDASGMIAVASELWDMGLPPERVLQDLARVFHRMAILQQLPDYEDPAGLEDQAAQAMYQQFHPEAIQLYYQILLHGLRDLDMAPDARMALEMTLLRLLAFVPESAEPLATAQGEARTSAATAPNTSVAPAQKTVNKPATNTQQQATHYPGADQAMPGSQDHNGLSAFEQARAVVQGLGPRPNARAKSSQSDSPTKEKAGSTDPEPAPQAQQHQADKPAAMVDARPEPREQNAQGSAKLQPDTSKSAGPQPSLEHDAVLQVPQQQQTETDSTQETVGRESADRGVANQANATPAPDVDAGQAKADDESPAEPSLFAPAEAVDATDVPMEQPSSVAQPSIEPLAQTAYEPDASTADLLGDSEAPWDELLKRLPITPITREFAANLQLVARDGSKWQFVMASELAYLRTKKQEQLLAKALSIYFGDSIQIQLDTRTEVTDTPAAAAAAQRSAAQQAAVDAVDQDPVMQRLQERFDARVIPNTIHPLDA